MSWKSLISGDRRAWSYLVHVGIYLKCASRGRGCWCRADGTVVCNEAVLGGTGE